MELEIRIYETENGKRPFSEWLQGLKDLQGKVKIRLRLDRLAIGHVGDCKSVGNGIRELRIYFGMAGKQCILLLAGGTKGSQAKDIQKAKNYFADYQERRD